MPKRIRPYLAPAFLALLGFLVRWRYSHFERTVWGDEPFYLWLGRNWFHGRGYALAFTGHLDYHHTPGYPFITAVLTAVTGDMKRASEWSFILFGVVLILAVYALACRIYGPRTAFAAGGLVALAPVTSLMPLYWGTMTEPPYWAFCFLGILFAHRAYTRFRASDVILSGVLFALGYYVRPEAVIYVGAMGLVLGLRALTAPPRLRRLAYPALLGLTFFIVIFPFLAYVRQQAGVWTISQKVGANFATAEGLASGDFERFDKETWGLDSKGENVRFFSRETADASASAYILANPSGYVRTVYGNILDLLATILSPRLLPSFFLLFVGLGLFARGWTRRRAWDELFLVATLLPGISFVLFFVQERYLAPLPPTLFIWTAHGLAVAGDWLDETLTNLRRGGSPATKAAQAASPWLVWAPTVLMLLFLLVYTPRQVAAATNPGSSRPAHDLAAMALKPYIQAGDVVMSRYVAIPFEAGAEWVPTPAADVKDVLDYARRKGVRFWAIDAVEAAKLRPQFAALLEHPDLAPPGLEFVTQVADKDGPVVIYRLDK